MDEGDHDDVDDIPVAELTEERPARTAQLRAPRHGRRTAAIPFACVALLLIAAGVVVANRANDDAPLPRAKVVAALGATTAMRSFDFRSTMTETVTAPPTTPDADCPPATNANNRYPGAGSITLCATPPGPPVGATIATRGTITLDPLALASVAEVPAFGEIRTWVNSTTVWEHGGGYYGLPSGGSLDGFADLVERTLGSRQGAVAMMSLASPTGYLNLAEDAITSASKIGRSSLDNVPVTDYEVTVDAARLADRRAMSTEERNTSVRALHRLEQEGYAGTDVQLGIDDAGLVREARTTVRFADGGAVTTTASFSNFGCREPIVFPQQVDLSATGCSRAAATTSTSTSTTTTTIHLHGEVIATGAFSGTEHFTFYDGRCPELDHHLDAVFTLDTGEQWKYRALYCGTIDDKQVWSGKGTFVFTRPDGSTISGDFTSTAQLPSPGAPYTLHITAPFTGTCEIDNHLVPLSFGVQEQNGSFTCAK